MIYIRGGAAIFVAALISGCGGGNDSSAPTPPAVDTTPPTEHTPTANADKLEIFMFKEVVAGTLSPLLNDDTISEEPKLVSIDETEFGNFVINEDDSVTFTPKRRALGTTIIGYTAEDNGKQYRGEIELNVGQLINLSAYNGTSDLTLSKPYVTTRVYSDAEALFGGVSQDDGSFSVSTRVYQPTDVVVLWAEGNSEYSQEQIKLTSIVGTGAELIQFATETVSGHLSLIEENQPSVRPTQLTTAEEILLVTANNDKPIVTSVQLEQAIQTLDAKELVEYAAIIELIGANGYVLPVAEARPQMTTTAVTNADDKTLVNTRDLFMPEFADELAQFRSNNADAISTKSAKLVQVMESGTGIKPLGEHVILIRNTQWSGRWLFDEVGGQFTTELGVFDFDYFATGRKVVATLVSSPSFDISTFIQAMPEQLPEDAVGTLIEVEFLFQTLNHLVKCIDLIFHIAAHDSEGNLITTIKYKHANGYLTSRMVLENHFSQPWHGVPDTVGNSKTLPLALYINDKWQSDLVTLNGAGSGQSLVYGKEILWSHNGDALTLRYDGITTRHRHGVDLDGELNNELIRDGKVVSSNWTRDDTAINPHLASFYKIETSQQWLLVPSMNQARLIFADINDVQTITPQYQQGYQLTKNSNGSIIVAKTRTICMATNHLGECSEWEQSQAAKPMVNNQTETYLRFSTRFYGEIREYKDWHLINNTGGFASVIELTWQDSNNDGVFDPEIEPHHSRPLKFWIDKEMHPLK
ncbi:Ig-like domain-containing protein [Shewanella sp. 10N.286.51.B8]|uniref:hypothetical protein n=1 Tax=Shewanella sp. 10N.286.51.B8 TaxID=3229708 RepID=UPI00354EF157